MIEYDHDAERLARAEREVLRLRRLYEISPNAEDRGPGQLVSTVRPRTDGPRPVAVAISN